MTLAARVRGAVLADNLGIALVLALVLLKTNEAFLGHSILHVVWGSPINFIRGLWPRPELCCTHGRHIL